MEDSAAYTANWRALTVPEDTVINWDRVSHAFPNMIFSSTKHADVPRKKELSSSAIDPLGRQQRTSSSWYPEH